MNRHFKSLFMGSIICVMLFLPGDVGLNACSVPVFRYALERWSESPYELLVIERAEPEPDERIKSDFFYSEEIFGLSIMHFDIAAEKNEFLEEVSSGLSDADLPYGILFPPGEMRFPQEKKSILWEGKLDEAGRNELKKLLYNPLTAKICRALAEGETAAWIFFKGGNEEENQRLLGNLRGALDKIGEDLELPHEMDPEDAVYSSPMSSDIPLRKSFKIIEANLNSPSNLILKRLLSIGDKSDSKLPMLVPVYGRARALGILKTEAISPEVIGEICFFLTGPCSCQVKALNPGFDLPALFPWDDIIYGNQDVDSVLSQKPWIVQRTIDKDELPEGSGDPAADIDAEHDDSQPGIIAVAILAILTAVIVALLVLVIIRYRNKREESEK